MKNIKLNKMLNKIVVVCMAMVMMFSLLGLGGCAALSNEEHIERISARVQERFIDSADYPYTDFTVTILYSTWAGEPQFFMVEFMPDGFIYGVIHRNRYYVSSFFRGSYLSSGWHFWENGDSVMIFRSHFHFYYAHFGLLSESRKYIHVINKFGVLAPAIKIDGYFRCLVEGSIFKESVRPRGVFDPASRSNRGDRL